MVEISEESTSASPEGSTNDHSYNAPSQESGVSLILNRLKSSPVDSALWVLRILTLLFSVLYVIPVGVNQGSVYQKALIAGAATNALRLHQRLGSFRFTREFLAEVFLEDSCHYLFYCLIFLTMFPVTMALFPVFLFALLHAANFTVQLLNVGRMGHTSLAQILTNFKNSYNQSLLLLIASAEIFLMPMVVMMIFMGKTNIFMPFAYYRFMSLRYMSRRNSSSRIAFYQIRIALEQAVSSARCPGFIRNLVHNAIGLVCRISPAVPPPASTG